MKKWIIFCTAALLFLCCGITAYAAIGDPDASGAVDAADARYVLRTAVGLEQPADEMRARCDVDHDGSVTAGDARTVLRVAVRLEDFTHPDYTGDEPVAALEPATCVREGALSYYCSCGEVLTVALPVTEHTPAGAVRENEVPASCTAEGSYDEAVYCAVCGAELSRVPVTVPVLPHTPGETVEENNVPATCSAAGSYDAVSYCTVCGAELSRTSVSVPALPHTAGETVKENEAASTCGVPGGYDTVVYCTVCGAEVSREHVTLPTLPHVSVVSASPVACIGTPPASLSLYRCADCGTFLADAEGHTALPGCFASLPEALSAAAEGDTVILLADQTITADLAVPAGVTLLLPYNFGSVEISAASKKLPFANAEANGAVAEVTPPGQDVTVKLTLSGGTLTVEKDARLILGGQYSGAQPIGGGTYGAHAELEIASDAAVCVKGMLGTFGYITGAGEVNLSGGTLYLPMVITDYHGGTYSAISYINEAVSPFNSYAFPNVQCPLEMDGLSSVYGYCVLFASEAQNGGSAKLISGSDALICVSPETTLRFTYNAAKTVPGYGGFGCTSVTASGDVTVKNLQLKAYIQMDTGILDFPVPYNLSYTQQSGTLTLAQRVKLMPGAELTIAEDAALQVKSSLYVLEGFAPGLYSAYHYPAASLLASAGYSPRARLTVNGAMTVENGAAFAGIAETDGTGSITFAPEAVLTATLKDGLLLNEICLFYTAIATNKTEYALSARLADPSGALFDAQAGKTYAAVSGTAAVLTGFAYVKYSGDAENFTAETVTAAYPAPETLVGNWQEALNTL